MNPSAPCPQQPYNEKFTVCSKKGRCNYHVCKEMLHNETMGPHGLCLDAYHILYPECLSILYGGKGFHGNAYCTGVESSVRFSIRAVSLSPRFKILNILKKALHPFWPNAIFEWGVTIRVEDVRGICPRAHESGQEYSFPLGNLQVTRNWIVPIGSDKLSCPAGFDNLFPYFPWLSVTGRFPWGSTASCPDSRARVYFAYEQRKDR